MSTKAAVSGIYTGKHHGAVTLGQLEILAKMLYAAGYDLDTVVYPYLDEENQQWALETLE